MHRLLYIFLFVRGILTEDTNLLEAKFYEDTEIYKYSCSVEFSRTMTFDCACVNGLWLLYNSCNDNITISGENQHCTRLSSVSVSKAVQLLKNRKELALLNYDGTVMSVSQDKLNVDYIDVDLTLVTGSDWTLVETSGTRVCLSVIEQDSYCYFRSNDYLQLAKIEAGCEEYDYFVDPIKCDPIGKESKNICEEEVEYKRLKRDADESEGGGGGGGEQTGRRFFGNIGKESVAGNASAPENRTENNGNSSVWLPADNEDFFNATGKNVTQETDSVATEIWNFIIKKVESLLDFGKMMTPADSGSEGKPKLGRAMLGGQSSSSGIDDITYDNPVYEFLEVGKRIVQKSCPPFYVRPEFLDVAVGAFIRMQQIHFRFPETSFKPGKFRRMLEALRECERQATRFNFTDADCNGKVDGNFTAFGQVLELSVLEENVGKEREPIIDTVWKVFHIVHSECFRYFNKSYNDHHRFTTWMMPLFQNQVHDLWMYGKTTTDSLGGLFGNQVEVQENLAYCTVYSRLESNYPWDLPKPARIAKFGQPMNFTKGRRKREVDDFLEYSSYSNPATGNCLDSNKPLLCPLHVTSISQVDWIG